MAINTCSQIIIHPEFKPYHLNATHFNISFRIALRNLANKRSSFHEQYVSDNNSFLSEPTSSELDHIITSDSDAEDEQPIQTGTTLDSSSPFVLESVHDEPFIPSNRYTAIEISNMDIPSSSTTNIQQLTNVSPPPTLLLDSIILQEVCENISQDLNKLVKTRSNLVHKENYVDQWTNLREKVNYVMCEPQKLSIEAYNQALKSLKEWFTEVVKSMEEVYDNMNQEKRKLYISDTPIYLDSLSIITSSVQSENPNLTWLTMLKIQAETPILEKLKIDSEQEKRIKKLEKELFEQRLMYAELKRKMVAQQEEAKVREEELVKSYIDLKESIKKELEKTNNMMQEMMEMMKKQVKP